VQVRTIGAAAGGPAVRRLAAGMLLSRTGDQLTTIALVWFVLDLTGSGLAVGLVLLCAGLPPVVTGPLLGRLLDRWPPRRVMVADNLARAALVAAIPALHWLGRLDMALLYGLSVAAGALVPATDVGVRVALPRLVDEADLERANLLLSVGDQVSALVGPAVGGLLVGLVGGPPVLLADAASFVAMAALVGPLPDPAGPAARPPAGRPVTRALPGGPAVRTVLALTLVYFLAYGPLGPALPLYSRDVLAAGAGGYGLLWSAFGAGALAGLATVPVVGRLRPGLALAGNALAWGAALGRVFGARRALTAAAPPGRGRRRAPAPPGDPDGRDRPVRGHLHARRRRRPLRPGPAPPPGPAVLSGLSWRRSGRGGRPPAWTRGSRAGAGRCRARPASPRPGTRSASSAWTGTRTASS
jgi:MFS family permease